MILKLDTSSTPNRYDEISPLMTDNAEDILQYNDSLIADMKEQIREPMKHNRYA